jgi:hypothetical protein
MLIHGRGKHADGLEDTRLRHRARLWAAGLLVPGYQVTEADSVTFHAIRDQNGRL